MSDKLLVREVIKEDCYSIWEWWNDPVTRKMMKKNDPVPWEEHTAWFEKLLKDTDRLMCVGFLGAEKIGNVRFDKQADQVYEVGINLNPLFRGKGYGTKILGMSISYLRQHQTVTKVYGMLKKVNLPSKRTFEKTGFTFMEPQLIYPSIRDKFDREIELYCEINFTE